MTVIAQRLTRTTQRRCAFDGARQAMLRLFAERVFTETAPEQRVELLNEIESTFNALFALWQLHEEAVGG